MKLVELHILQSFPVTCLNRDDLNAPKAAFFGGVQRARVSSQSWKRAIREMASKIQPALFAGNRSHYFAEKIKCALEDEGIDSAKSVKNGEKIAQFIGKRDSKYKEGHKTSVALYLTPQEVAGIAKVSAEQIREKGEVNLKTGALKKALSKIAPGDMADIAIFGRMVAADHTLMIEGAGLFSHALSTHGVSNDIDFFSAIDDLQPEISEGAGHIGTLEFNSACYYRYVGLNLDLLADEDHLKHLSVEDRKAGVDTFIRASILSVPNARRNSMFGHNPPAFVLGLSREGQPLSLANAFESGIKSRNGYIEPSKDALTKHYEHLKQVYGIAAKKVVIPDANLDTFCKEMLKDVV